MSLAQDFIHRNKKDNPTTPKPQFSLGILALH